MPPVLLLILPLKGTTSKSQIRENILELELLSKVPSNELVTVYIEEASPWHDASLGTTPALARHQPWHDASLGTTPALTRCQPWHYASLGTMPALARRQPWHDSSLGTTPALARCQPWYDAAVNISTEVLTPDI